jgi:hypothetical protein
MSVRSRLESTPDTQPAVPAVNAPEGEQDPSMPGVPTVAAPVTAGVAATMVAPVAAPVAAPVEAPAPVELPEKRHTWQPVDEDGEAMGGVQVIIYKTEQELIEKMQEKSVLLLRQLRKERREKALGVPEERIDDAEKFKNIAEFKPRELSADERFSISQGIANPETFADARDALLESAFGVKPAVLASTLNAFTRREIQQSAVENYIEFVNTSGFVDTPKSRALVTGWLGTRNLAPTVANFQIAQKRLTEAGLLESVPVVQPEPVVPTPAPVAAVPPVAEEPKPQVPTTPSPALVTPELQVKRQSHVPSGLTASIASPAASITDTAVGGYSMTLAEIDRMSSDDYKRKLRDPKFAAYVNQLEADAAARRRARVNG